MGGGPHGVCAARALASQGATVRIVDPAPRLLHRWEERAGTVGMTWMRSPQSHHLDALPVAALARLEALWARDDGNGDYRVVGGLRRLVEWLARGLDVLSLLPSEYLTDHEIAAASMANKGAVFNPQQQLMVTWPTHPSVAHAYLDQLERDSALPEDSVLQLRSALDRSMNQWESGKRDRRLAETVGTVQQGLIAISADGLVASRVSALTEQLSGISARFQ